MKARVTHLKSGEVAEFEAPDPPLQPGEILEWTEPATTAAGHHFKPGDTIALIERTEDAPWDLRCSLGNWRVHTKYQVPPSEGIWSNIDWAFSEGRLKRQPKVPTRWERLRQS